MTRGLVMFAPAASRLAELAATHGPIHAIAATITPVLAAIAHRVRRPGAKEPVMSSKPSVLDRALRPFATVRAGEGAIALLLFGCVFTMMCAYYLLKTAREGLIL